MELTAKIEEAFQDRKMPVMFLVPEQLAKHETDDVMVFLGKHWSSLTTDELEKYFEAIYWFTPEAFCYYLPGIYTASIKENEPDLMVNQSIVGMLDRSPDRELWDDFFLTRWPLLNKKELDVTEEWLLWLSSHEGSSTDEVSIIRALDTISLLRENCGKRGRAELS